MKLFLLIFLTLSLYADTKQQMLNLYQNKKYEEVCHIGFNNFKQNKHDEDYISLYAFACLKSDYIDRLSKPMAMLKFSKDARANSAYFSVILMQKKLLYHAMIDGYDLSGLNFPTTDHILSKVFDLYSKLGKHKSRKYYLFEGRNDKKVTYKLYVIRDKKINKVVIEEYYDSVLIKKHMYW